MAAPPSGVVTLLFTDVEGSTKLLRRLGERYADLLEDHRRLLRAAIARHGGYEFGAEGDALFAAFADARASLTRSPNSLGVAARNEGDLDRAKAYLEERDRKSTRLNS